MSGSYRSGSRSCARRCRSSRVEGRRAVAPAVVWHAKKDPIWKARSGSIPFRISGRDAIVRFSPLKMRLQPKSGDFGALCKIGKSLPGRTRAHPHGEEIGGRFTAVPQWPQPRLRAPLAEVSTATFAAAPAFSSSSTLGAAASTATRREANSIPWWWKVSWSRR